MAGPGDGMSEEESEGLDVEARGWGGGTHRGDGKPGAGPGVGRWVRA